MSIHHEDTPAAKLDKLVPFLERYNLGHSNEVVPLFASLLSIPVEDRYPPLNLSPARQKEKTLDALIDWLTTDPQESDVAEAVHSMDWNRFAFVTLFKDDDNWLNGSGCMEPDFGLSMMLSDDRIQYVTETAPPTPDSMLETFKETGHCAQKTRRDSQITIWREHERLSHRSIERARIRLSDSIDGVDPNSNIDTTELCWIDPSGIDGRAANGSPSAAAA